MPTLAAWLIVLLLACARPASAQYFRYLDPNEEANHFLVFNYRHWFMTGGTSRRSNHPTQPANVSVGVTENMKTSAGMEVFSAEIRPTKRVYFGIDYGTTLSGNGKNDVHYWIHEPHAFVTSLQTGYTFFEPNHTDWETYTESLNSRTTLLAANVFIHVMDNRFGTLDEGYTHSLDALFGYSRFEESYNETDLVRTLSPGTEQTARPVGPVLGLSSTFHALWQGPHVGIREAVSAPHGFFFDGIGMISPIAIFSGDGYDNLGVDTGFMNGLSPRTFSEKATGWAMVANISAGWKPIEMWKVYAGYGIYYFNANNGSEHYKRSDDSTNDIRLDYVRTLRQGIFLGTGLSF